MKTEESISILKSWRITGDKSHEAVNMAINALGAIDQIQWERDLAIKQLHDLGYGLGEKPREEDGYDLQPDLHVSCNKLQNRSPKEM